MNKVWTDGSCKGNPGPGGWGVVFEDGREFSGKMQGTTTNNRAELTAIIEAVKRIPNQVPYTLYSDSQWSINVVTRQWRATQNLDLVRDCQSAMLGKIISFQWVKGHSGDPNNEKADKLASEAVRGRTVAREVEDVAIPEGIYTVVCGNRGSLRITEGEYKGRIVGIHPAFVRKDKS